MTNKSLSKAFASVGAVFMFVVCLLTSCQSTEFIDELPEESSASSAPILEYNHLPITKNPLPAGKHSLNVLAIGNSYTEDGVAYMQEILDAAGIDRADYCVYKMTRGSSSLQFWSEQLLSDDDIWAIRVAGGRIEVRDNHVPMREILAHNWDVVVVQQFSQSAIDYNTFNPYLTDLLQGIAEYCPNKDVAIAWQLIMPYGKDYSSNKELVGNARWQKIANATKEMMLKDGIQTIIPTGTAIQIARGTELNTPYDLTRDHVHLCQGVGRYIAASTWAETLFGPVFNMTIKDLKVYHTCGVNEPEIKEEMIEDSMVDVDETNRKLCQKVVLAACQHPFSLDFNLTKGIPAIKY